LKNNDSRAFLEGETVGAILENSSQRNGSSNGWLYYESSSIVGVLDGSHSPARSFETFSVKERECVGARV